MINERLLERLRMRRSHFPIRRALPDDWPQVLKLYCCKLVEEEHLELTAGVFAAAKSAVVNALMNPDRVVLVAEDEDRIIGQGFMDIVSDPVSLDRAVLGQAIFVLPKYRWLGVADDLLLMWIDFAKGIGASRITFFHGSEGCSKFYERLGAEVSRIEYEVKL